MNTVSDSQNDTRWTTSGTYQELTFNQLSDNICSIEAPVTDSHLSSANNVLDYCGDTLTDMLPWIENARYRLVPWTVPRAVPDSDIVGF